MRLLDNNAILLGELIRTVMAVDVEPASQLLVQLGVNPGQIPPGMFVPASASWVRLIIWLLKVGAQLPVQALGDVVEFYTQWMLGTFGHGPFTPTLLGWLHAWLVEIEEDRTPKGAPQTFRGWLGYGEGRGLSDKLRTGFLLFSNKRPELAVDYLKRVRAYDHGRSVVSSVKSLSSATPFRVQYRPLGA
jgi:hypothetical protein